MLSSYNTIKSIQRGITYVEVIISVTITTILVGALMNVIGTSTDLSEEIKKAFEDGTIKDFKEIKFNNYEFLFSSKEMQEKVFIQGL